MLSIVKAKRKDAVEILTLQKIAYQSEAVIYNDVELVFMEKYNSNPLAGWHDLDAGAVYRQFFHPFKARR